MYNSGLTLVLLGMLEEMTYGDVVFLRTTFEIDGDEEIANQRGWFGNFAAIGTLDAFHQERLASRGLIRKGIGKGSLPTMLVTELGRRMLALLTEPTDEALSSTAE